MPTLKNAPSTTWATNSLSKPKDEKRIIKDCFFLGGIVLILQASMIWDLGMYSDDWAFLAIFHHADDQSIQGLIHSFFSQDRIARMRPVQIVNLAVMYWFFGEQLLGYHITNSVYILAIILLFYQSLRLLNLPRLLVITIPLVYGLLPHYSTDRIWMATFQTNISILMLFLNFIALEKYATTAGGKSWAWEITSLLSLAVSILAYEIALPLFVFSFSIFMWRRRVGPGIFSMLASHKVRAILFANFLVFGLCIVFKAWISIRTGGFESSYWSHVTYVYIAGFLNDFIIYGLQSPLIAWQIFSNYSSVPLLGIGLSIGVLIFLYLKGEDLPNYSFLDWCKISLIGLLVYLAGYAIFLTTVQFMVHPTGLANRVTMAACIGVAICFVAAICIASSLISSVRLKRYFMAISIALVGTFGFITNYTIATFFHKAYQTQLDVISDIQKNIPDLKDNSVLIIDGFCPFNGPAPVFESYWDVTGALRITYNLEKVRGDFRGEGFRFDEKGVTSIVYGEEKFYAFNKDLIIYNLYNKQKVVLDSFEAAKGYFGKEQSSIANACPEGEPGNGVNIFYTY
ncbi:hypothetical protein [Sabulibacter ruber]|uniref:hypothetical protein n=1 Tax=Sabulibacter ruber TaxID=2811901 RepID=UPI001A9692ED|nr:hypothetical protein [Sabulibacter ruber]